MEDYIDIHYKNNYLTNVIFRLDFSTILEITTHIPDKFQKKIIDIFPNFEQQVLVKYSTFFNENEKIDKKQEIPSYQFKDETKIAVLTQDYLVVEFYKYNHFEDFKDIVKKVVSSFVDIYTPKDFKRMGLRYINQIIFEKGNPLIWNDYINYSLIHVVDKFLDRNENLARAMGQIILNYEDFKINFNYGLFNSEFPAKISRKEFVLDYDCYTEDIEYENMFDRLELFNTEIKKLFEASIKKGLRNKMEVINEQI